MGSSLPPPDSLPRRLEGMRKTEQEIFGRWWAQHATEYDRVEFNVRVGPGQDPGPSVHPDDRRGLILSSQRRIDVVAWRRDVPTIIEVEELGRPSGLAQLVIYKDLWLLDYPSSTTPVLVLLAGSIRPDVARICASLGITCVEVGQST